MSEAKKVNIDYFSFPFRLQLSFLQNRYKTAYNKVICSAKLSKLELRVASSAQFVLAIEGVVPRKEWSLSLTK